jgi:endonuclease YncB( thermonuclease family)
MKLLSLLISLVLGIAVLLVFVRPWGALNSISEKAAQSVPAVPATSSSSDKPASHPQPTVAPAKPVETPPSATASTPQATPPSEDRQRKPLRAREQAEAERNAALHEKEHPVAPPAPKTKRYFRVKVRDAGTLEVRLARSKTAVISLEGIKAHDADAMCERKGSTKWPCGAKARRALISLIRGRAVVCTLPPAGESEAFAARCGVGGDDLSTWLVRQGWATPKADAPPALGEALAAAKSDQLGMWGGE